MSDATLASWRSRRRVTDGPLTLNPLSKRRSRMKRPKLAEMMLIPLIRWWTVALSAATGAACGTGTIGSDIQIVDATPPQLSGLTAVPTSGTTAVVSWSTDELATSIVEYGTSASYGQANPL